MTTNRRWKYLLMTVGCVAVALGVAYLTPRADPSSVLGHFIEGFGGNVTAGLVTSILLIPLGLYLTATTDAAVEEMHTAVADIHRAVEKQERVFNSERLKRRFEDFMREGIALRFSVSEPKRGGHGWPWTRVHP